jgi:hypothetical protein
MNTEKTVTIAAPDQVFSLAARFATRVNSLELPEQRIKDAINNGDDPLWSTIDEALLSLKVEKEKSTPSIPEKTSVKQENPLLQDWADFYKKYFGLTLDLSGVRISEKVEGFDRLIVVAVGMSINLVYETGKKNFNSWKWCNGDLETKVRKCERGKVKAAYAFWVRDNREADDDLKNTSALMIEDQEIDTENLLERLLHGLKYWSETSEHLDVHTITLCASSRGVGGLVPGVFRFDDGGVYVCGCEPGRRDAYLRARRVVR